MKKRLLVTITIISIIGAIVWLVIWAQAPARGSVSFVSTPSKTASPLPDKKLEGTYISFQYRGEYSARVEDPANSDLERHTLDANTQYNKQILASVVILPGGQLQGNGDYLYRQKSTNTYINRKLHTNGSSIDIWVKKDGTEQTAMVQRGERAAVVSLITDPGVDTNLTVEMNELLKTLEWNK